METPSFTTQAVVQNAINAALVVMLGFLMRHFKRNRESGKRRDSSVDNVATVVQQLSARVETLQQSNRELSSQVGAMAQEVYRDRVETGIVKERANNMERELSHLRVEVRDAVRIRRREE